MRFEKSRPGGLTLPIWRLIQPVSLENVADGLVRDGVSEVGDGAQNLVKSPAGVLSSHLQDKRDDLLWRRRPAGPASGNRCNPTWLPPTCGASGEWCPV